MKKLALIPARGGSVGLPGKNIAELGGKPLIPWTVEAACKSKAFDDVVVSTDDPEIAETAAEWGADIPFMRPAELATPTATTADVVLHALDTLDFSGLLVVLQPTSPFRTDRHIQDALKLRDDSDGASVVSVTATKPLSWIYAINSDRLLSPAVPNLNLHARRQDAPPVVVPNGAIYIRSSQHFRQTNAFITPDTVGFMMNQLESIDIDDAADMALARSIVAAGLHVAPK